jgi:RimJ/RimL family protein N-acetyltransferase
MRPDDAALLHTMYRDPTTLEYIASDPPRAIEDTLAGIARRNAHQEQYGFALWSVVERASGSVVGECGLQMLEGGPDVELGYKLARGARGRGYATEASSAWIERGFGEIGLDRIVAVAWPDNVASRRVMEKVGMTLVGPGRHYGHETVLYELTPAARA